MREHFITVMVSVRVSINNCFYQLTTNFVNCVMVGLVRLMASFRVSSMPGNFIHPYSLDGKQCGWNENYVL